MAVAGDGRLDLLLDPVAIEDAALADEEIAVISVGALPREGERDFDDVRGLDRAGEVVGAERGRTGAGAGESFQPEF